jgi:hypothetical protein
MLSGQNPVVVETEQLQGVDNIARSDNNLILVVGFRTELFLDQINVI